MTLREKRQRSGQLGGLTTSLRHRGRHQEWGKLGGRRRLPTLAEYQARSRKEASQSLPSSIPALLKMLREDAYAEVTATINRKGRLGLTGLPGGQKS